MQFPPNIIPLLVTYQIRVANNGAILFYNGIPGPGTLVGAISPGNGTDAFGNSYLGGFWWEPQGGSGNPYVDLGGIVNSLRWGNTFIGEMTGSSIAEFGETTGTPNFFPYGLLLIRGPQDNTQEDAAFIAIQSSTADGTSIDAAVRIGWATSPSLTEITYETVSFDGAQIAAGNVIAVHPGTGTGRSNRAVAETWQTPASINAGWTTAGANTPARYRLEPYGDGGGVVRLDGELLTTGAGPWPAGTDIFNLGTGYTPASGHMFVNKSSIAVAAGNATVNVTSSGNVVNGQTFTAAGQSLYLDGMTFPLN